MIKYACLFTLMSVSACRATVTPGEIKMRNNGHGIELSDGKRASKQDFCPLIRIVKGAC